LNNEAERTIRPVKVQQRSSGGCWRTLHGLADFAIVQSYLSTAAKWDISKLDALHALFSGNPGYQPPSNPASSQPAFHTTTSRRRLVNSCRETY
jgi:transposase